jgi:IclR family acetate operon transcriptional repressor
MRRDPELLPRQLAASRPRPRPAAGPERGEGRASPPALKVFGALEVLAAAGRPLSITDLSVLLDVPKPTMHRIVRQLEADSLVGREPRSRLYVPGPRLLNFALDVVAASASVASRHAILESLSAAVGETCNFGMMVGNAVVYLDRVEAAWPFGLRFETGSRVPLHCTSMGKLFLSALPRRKADEVIRAVPLYRYTENTITDPDALAAELDRIRTAGFSSDNQEFLAGVVCLAVPVLDRKGVTCAALAVSAPIARMTLARAMDHLPALREATRRLAETFHEPRVAQRKDGNGAEL